VGGEKVLEAVWFAVENGHDSVFVEKRDYVKFMADVWERRPSVRGQFVAEVNGVKLCVYERMRYEGA
jgi:hypothetical protein